jgi:hypothetical protein
MLLLSLAEMRSSHQRLQRWLPILLLALACTESVRTPTQLERPADVRAFVTPAVTASLNPEGFFVLPSRDGDATRISAARAAELAATEVSTFEAFNRTYLESQRGTSIDFGALHVEPRVYYAESPYMQDLPADVHPALRKYAGPYYLVTLSDIAGPVLSVAVSSYNTDVAIENGRIMLAPNHGGDFRVQATRVGNTAGMPVSPEQAARIASEALHVRISAVPELILPPNSFVPQYARWRLQLERAVPVRGARTGRAINVQTVFIGLGGELSIPLDGVDAASTPPNFLTRRDPSTGRDVPFHARPDMPLAFEPLSL